MKQVLNAALWLAAAVMGSAAAQAGLDVQAQVELEQRAPVSEVLHQVIERAVLREQPRAMAPSVIEIPSLAQVRLGAEIYNADGYWRYAEFEGHRGWLAARSIAGAASR